MTGVFGAHAPEYLDAGLVPVPVDTRRKKPAVRHWQRAGAKAARAWASGRLGEADGLGVVMGERSRLVEVDIDTAGAAALGQAIERFGETPIVIRTASGKSKLWFRHNGEGRLIRPIRGLEIDVLGAGLTVAPPSRRDDLGASYSFLQGGLDDLGRLPAIRPGALDSAASKGAEAVQRGERNRRLFLWCMAEARRCDDLDALVDAAQTWAEAMFEPLSACEIEAVCRSAWGYETSGRNFIGLKKPAPTHADKAMDALLDAPDAYLLQAMFRRWHTGRENFVIAPTAMEGEALPWTRRRIEHARDVLLERGLIEMVRQPRRGGQPGAYRLTPMK